MTGTVEATTTSPDHSGVIHKLNNPSRLGGIDYRVAETSADYRACHQLAEREGLGGGGYTFPTIMALKDGDLLGFVSTYLPSDMIAMGPLVLDGRSRHPFLAMRLIDAYNTTMKSLGIEWYVFSVDEDSHVNGILERLGFSPYAESEGKRHYLREFG